MILLRTPRLTLRTFEPEDLNALHGMLTDEALLYYLPGLRSASREDTEIYLRSIAGKVLENRMILAVVDHEDALLGALSLNAVDATPGGAHWMIGYFVRSDRWNEGIATEAARAACGWLFERGAFRVSATCLAENLGSRRVLEKCGMTQEGLLRANTWHAGQWRDSAVFSILREEYDRRKRHVP